MRDWICGHCHTRLTGDAAGVCPSCAGEDIVPLESPRGASLAQASGGLTGGPNAAAAPPQTGPPTGILFRPIQGWAAIAVVVAIVLGVGGFVHVVSTDDGLRLCTKETWALGGTFVDVDDLTGVPILSLLDRAATVRALLACGILERPEAWNR